MAEICTKLMLIRHAEKPDDDAGVLGVTEAGQQDKDDLSVRGWQRSGALVRLFGPTPPVKLRVGMATPGAIFAAQSTDASPSKRPKHTVKALAEALGLEVLTPCPPHQEAQLVAMALAAAETVLICWHHERIGALAQQVGCDPGAWPADVFDRVLVLDRAGAGWILTRINQDLLPGDAGA